MQMGQPALLYLVPCCLGTISFLGWKKGEMKELWDGPDAIRDADAMLYGEYDHDGPPGHDDGGVYVDEGNGAEDRFPPTIAEIPPKEEDVASSTAPTGPLEVVTSAGDDGGSGSARKRGAKGSGSLL